MAKSRLVWHGEKLLKRAASAQRFGVNKTMSECVIHAKTHHAFRNRTTTLEGGIRIVNFATPHGRGMRGVWGVADVVYARRIEEGFNGTDSLGRSYNQPAYPYLRPAADAVYPRLAANISQAWRSAK